jgi:type I restriction enzyme S subunit
MSEWVESPLSQLATFQKGRKVDTSPFNGDGYAPYLGASGLEGGDDGFAATRLAVIAKSTDTLMLWDGERSGLVGYGRQGVVASTVSKLSPSDKVEPKYLYYALSERFDWIQHRRTGTGVPHVPKDLRRLLKLRYPKQRTVQQRIATILSGIDTAIEKTEALIAKYQQIKAGLMHDLFTRGVLPNGQLRPPREQAPELYQETAIGWIPKEWQYELLDKLALRGSGHTPNKNFPEYWNGGIKWVSLADSHRLDQLYISETELQISHKGIQNSSAVLHPAGIVVLSRDAGVGKSAITTEPMAVSQHFMCWKCDQKMDNHFLYYWLQFNKRTFENIAMGSTILTIGLPYFKKMKIACPIELEEQRNIAAKIKASDARIFSLQDELSKLKQQTQGLMHDLLTGKVLVTIENNPTTTEAVA